MAYDAPSPTEKTPAKPEKPRLSGDDAGLAAIKGWYASWEDATQTARLEAERDRDYYDGIQWTAEEVSELQRRNQPVVTVNRIAPKMNFILGSEIQTRTDPHAYPRGPAVDDEAADACTDALRYVDDAEELDQKFSEGAEDGLICGCAALIVEIDKRTMNPKVRVVSWDRFWYDPHSRKRDFSDAQYVGIVKWLDYDEAVEFYGEDATDALEATTAGETDNGPTTHDDRPSKLSWFDHARNRVKVCEVYWREGQTHRYATVTGGGFLRKPADSPFKTDRGESDCPVVAWSAFVNRQNERYGIVRAMRSPQDEVNKRRSKALDLLTRRQVIADKGAVEHPESARTELAKPDGYIEVVPGLRFEPVNTTDLTMAQFNLLSEAKGEIDATGPSVSAAAEAGAASGRLFLARQKAASMQLEPVFDSFRQLKKHAFRKIWYRICQFWTFEKWVRVRDDEERNGFRFVGLNRRISRAERLMELLNKGAPLQSAIGMLGLSDPQRVMSEVGQVVQMQMQAQAQAQAQAAQGAMTPGGQGPQMPPEQGEQMIVSVLLQHPDMQTDLVANDISRLDVDIILDESPDTVVMEQEQFEQLGAIGPTLIQSGFPAPMFAELLIEASQFRNRRKMLEIIRQASQPNPQAGQEQAEAKQLAQAQAQANVERTRAQAQQAQASAAKALAEAQTAPARAAGEQAYAMKTAAEAGRASVPEINVAQGAPPMA